MPANLLADMNAHSGNIEDQRAFQIALDLSQLSMIGNGLPHSSDDSRAFHNSSPSSDENDVLKKKGANMTECVPVPSSEHVAEIVGRQGCKIKALRAKTNTYIKTPVRGEEPVFVVTGRREDVQAAKREILSAAEHFSQIRATRRNNMANVSSTTPGTNVSLPPSPNAPGQVTIQVRVPYRVVGLVVGPKGATIKRIQQNTHTYIVTPSRDKEPVFEVTGLPEDVEKARGEIESHIAMRTGGVVEGSGSNDNDDFHSNGVDSGFHEMSSDLAMFKSSKSAFTAYNEGTNSNNFYPQQEMNVFNLPPPVTKISDYTLTNGLNGLGMYDDEGIGGSPSFDPSHPVSSVWPEFCEGTNLYPPTTPAGVVPRRGSLNGSHTPRLSPTLMDGNDHPSVRRIRSEPLSTANGFSAFTPFQSNGFTTSTTSSSLSSSSSTSPTSDAARRRGCLVCSDNNITAALVPCGHNLFCMECANLICEKPDCERRCPVCSQLCTQAIRIFS